MSWDTSRTIALDILTKQESKTNQGPGNQIHWSMNEIHTFGINHDETPCICFVQT